MLQSMSLLPQLLIQFIYCWAHSSLNSFVSTHLWKIYQTYGHDFGWVKSNAWRIPVKIISNLIIFIFTVMNHNLLKDIELLHWTFGIFPEARILFFSVAKFNMFQLSLMKSNTKIWRWSDFQIRRFCLYHPAGTLSRLLTKIKLSR